jgi:multidrug efflux system outer membrane protein
MKLPTHELRQRFAHGALLASLVSLTACVNLAPDYVRPAAPVPAGWQAQVAGSAKADAAAIPETDWRDVIVDARLRQVVERALDGNRDLRVAIANIEKARASYRIQRADLFPALNASGSMTRERTSAAAASSGVSSISSTYKAQLGISSYELDLFGRVSNLSEAALQAYLSLAETQRSVRLSLIAEVSTAWLTLAADQQQLRLARETLATRERSLDLLQQAKALGGESGPSVAAARASREAARASAASYASVVEQDRHALDLLVGATVPDDILPGDAVASDEAGSSLLLSVPAGLSSSVLLRRPDVLAAEHTLMAYNADIGAVRAAFFPTVSLTGSGGSTSRSLDNLFSAGSGAWSFAPSISLPIFDAGANRAGLDSARAQQAAGLATYEKTIQTAFQEVADALSVRSHVGEQLDAQREQVAALALSLRYAEDLRREGSGSALDVLDAQRSLFTAQQSLISLRLSEQSNRVTLFKVLGGGAMDASAKDAKDASARAG